MSGDPLRAAIALTGDGTVKGWPAGMDGRGPGVLTVSDLPTPSLVLRRAALAANIAAMAAWCARWGAALAPHAKTTMAPSIMRRQLAAGAWGMTVADVRQARVADRAGAARILVANQVLARDDLAWIASRHGPGTTLVAIDSAEGLAAAAAAGAGAGAAGPVRVLVEVGYPGGRGGVRDAAAAVALAREVAAAPGVVLAGVTAYEGLIAVHARRGGGTSVAALLQMVAAVARAVAPLCDGPPLLSAGGTAYFDAVTAALAPCAGELGGLLVLRSGCYVTHDHGLYARALGAAGDRDLPRLTPALELRARVLSRPEPGRAILDAGRRDCSYDAGLPVVLGVERDGGRARLAAEIVAFNDEHAHLVLDAAARLRPGDVVVCGISHPCTTFERWRLVAEADDDDRVVEAVATVF